MDEHKTSTPREPRVRPERTEAHEAAVDGVGHGGPVAPDPLDDQAPEPLGGVKPDGGDPPPKGRGGKVPFIE